MSASNRVKQMYQIDCTFPNKKQQSLRFSPQKHTNDGTVDKIELQRFIYEQLKDNGIHPTTQYIIFTGFPNWGERIACYFLYCIAALLFIISSTICGCCFLYALGKCSNKQIATRYPNPKRSKPELITSDSNNVIKAEIGNYNQHRDDCILGYGAYKPSHNEIAYPVSSSTNCCGFAMVMLITMPFIWPAYTVCGSYINDGNDFWIWFIILPFLTFGILMLSFYLAIGRLWLIINTNKHEIYLQDGNCFDRCFFAHKYKYDINQFRGIRLQKKKNDVVEDTEKGMYLKLLMDDNNDRVWSRGSMHDMSYYHFIKLFRERYPNRDDVRFSLPKGLKMRLYNFGVNDSILDESWNTSAESVDLLIKNEGINELKTLISFVQNENYDDLATISECDDIMLVINNGKYNNEMIEYYEKIKNEYSAFYPNKNTNYLQKIEFSNKMVTLIANKAKEYNVNTKTVDNNGNNDVILMTNVGDKDTINSALLLN